MTETTTANLITTPFGFDSTAAEVIEGINLHDKRAIVTGGSSGIGVETARALASAGAEVTLAVRDTEAGERTAAEIRAATGNPDVRVGRLDLADRASVAEFVSEWDGPLHLLINNAGVMALQQLTLTPEGWELQFATNHLGHFALALGLHDALATAATRGSCRSAPAGTCAHRSSSRTSTSAPARMTRGSATASRRPPTSCSRSRRRAAGPPTGSPPTRSTRARSRRRTSHGT